MLQGSTAGRGGTRLTLNGSAPAATVAARHVQAAPAAATQPRRRHPSSAAPRPPRRPRLAPAGAAASDGTPPALRQAGPQAPAPDYAPIDAQPLNRVVMALFRRKMVAAIGSDSQLEGCARHAAGAGPARVRGLAPLLTQPAAAPAMA
jgi:hypothetical protein